MKKISIKIRLFIILCGLMVALFMPYIFSFIKNVELLNGERYTVEKSAIYDSSFFDGESQNLLTAYISENLPGLAPMIRLRNQMIYSIFNKSTNKRLVLGKNGYLFEKQYLHDYEKITKPISENDLREVFDDLCFVRDKLAEQGTDLYMLISPCKIRYYEGELPDIYDNPGYYKNELGNYEILKKVLRDYDFNVFDSIEYIDNLIIENNDVIKYPLFQSTGTHWTWTVAIDVVKAFIEYMKNIGNYRFPIFHQVIATCSEPFFPDADIYNTLNIMKKPSGQYYSSDIVIDEYIKDEDKPNVVIRGSSFVGESLWLCVLKGFFNQDVNMTNTLIMTDRNMNVNSFNDYDELDMKTILKDKDILIIEFNEAIINNIGMGMIKYLKEHPECFE